MILADKIIDLRKKNGWSQEELAEQLGVSRQTVSKWEGAQSVPDMGRVVQMSTLFGVSTDYLLKDDMELPEPTAGAQPEAPERSVNMEEANEFLRVKAVNARCVALGVLLCVLSPVCLILLGGAQSYGLLGLSEAQTTGLGLAVLLLMVGGAVALFVTSAVRVSPYAWLEEESVDTLYGVDGMVKERREQYRPRFTLQLTLGIVLCVLSAVPIFLSVMLYGEQEGFAHVLSVALTLALVAVGVWLIVRSSMVWGAFQQLLEEGDYTRASKENKRKLAPFNGVYWGLVTAGYLAWSFLSGGWNRTWIVWPVAGVAYGAIFGILKLVRK
ncbi:MAG: helix-turn-helix transcriptional regulator [Oscillospiraceae bacterium]|nr:helix-turn-helix transcriptional regulator [Oscillospiraceae bacterium]MBR3861295.1 helix-turn-helix transcriptional regulator [Oscillospiraceae bacterium]